MTKDIMTAQEFIVRNKTEDLCFELDDERLTDDIDEFLEEKYNDYNCITEDELNNFCQYYKKIAVYTKYRFKLTSKFIFESIQDHLDDNFAFQDNIESLTGKSFFDNVCEEFNKRFETYTTDELIGFMDLSKELKEYIEKEVKNDNSINLN